MVREPRGPHARLEALIGLVAALVWGSVAVRALIMDDEPSPRALVACVALVLVGIALAPLVRTLAAPRRARRRPSEAARMSPTAAVLLGMMVIGLAAAPILDTAANAWDWALLVAASLVGGLNIGVALPGTTDQAAAYDAPHPPARR